MKNDEQSFSQRQNNIQKSYASEMYCTVFCTSYVTLVESVSWVNLTWQLHFTLHCFRTRQWHIIHDKLRVTIWRVGLLYGALGLGLGLGIGVRLALGLCGWVYGTLTWITCPASIAIVYFIGSLHPTSGLDQSLPLSYHQKDLQSLVNDNFL